MNNRRRRSNVCDEPQRRILHVQVGIDLGRQSDHTAVVVAEHFRADDSVHRVDVRHAERLDLGLSFPVIADRIADLVDKLNGRAAQQRARGEQGFRVRLAVDSTGLGGPVIDLLRERRLSPVPVILSGGDGTTLHQDGRLIVAKSHLVSTLTAFLQTNRLGLPDTVGARQLADELDKFEVQLTASGALTWNASGSSHDDLVIAAGLAVLELPDEPMPLIVATGRARRVW